jgi:hypothetical protein
VDLQTGEYYDLQITSQVITVIRAEAGPSYLASTTFEVWGPRIGNLTQLYGFIQKPAIPYEPTIINFTYQGTGFPAFRSEPVNLYDNNCIDLHSSSNRTQQNYIATICYKNSYIAPGGQTIAYSPNANPYIEFTYSNNKTTTLQFLSTAFNKYNNLSPYDGVNGRGSRVNYLTIDPQNSSLNSFQNVKYIIAGLISGLNDEQASQLCNIGASYPKKYLKQTTSVKPEGGSNFEITTKIGYCSFEYISPFLKPFYLSLYMDGGVPLPSLTPTPSSIPTSTSTPTVVPTLTPTSIPIPTASPTPTIRPTPTPTIAPNRAPVITTSFLPSARRAKPYAFIVTGYDLDLTDSLTMTLTNLPPGITQKSCTATEVRGRKQIACSISGTPSTAGTYQVNISLKDNRGGTTQKILPLRVY